MGVLAIVGREVPRIELDDRRRAHLRPPPADDGATGAHRAGRERRAVHARHRPLAPDRDREHVRPVVRQAAAPHARVPRRAHAAAARRQGRRRRRDHLDPRRRRRRRTPAVPGARRRARPEDARARGHRHRRHRHVDDRARRPSPTHTVPDDHRRRRTRRAARRREIVASLPSASPPTSTRRASAPRRTSRSTASCRRTARCSTAKARPGPADVAIVGDEATVTKALGQLADAGVTEYVAVDLRQPRASATRPARC